MKDSTIYIDHILEAISSVEEFTHGLSESDFLKNRMVQAAVVRQFEIIGEATKRISKEFRNTHSNIAWDDMAGMRDKLIHDYIDVDYWIVWKAAKEDLPVLKKQLEKLFNQ
jgi:uncharacterized protein with HEPN domain